MNNMNEKEKLDAVFGREVEVEVLTKNETGEVIGKTLEKIRVKELSISQHSEAMKNFDDIVAFIVLCTGKSREWVESLSYNSLSELDEVLEDVNKGFFRYLRRRQKRLLASMQGLSQDDLEKLTLFTAKTS